MVELFKSLGEENRLRILALLVHREMCVCEIEESLKMTQSNVSRHLTALKSCGILDSAKKAQWAYYKISEKFKDENPNLWLYLVQQFEGSQDYQKHFIDIFTCSQTNLCDIKTRNKTQLEQ